MYYGGGATGTNPPGATPKSVLNSGGASSSPGAAGAGGAGISFPRTVCRSASSVLGMIHWQWRTIEVASGVMNAWPPKEERKREVLTFRGAKVTSVTPMSDPKQYQKLMKNAADAAAKRPSNVPPITQPAFVRLELPVSAEKDKGKDKDKTREVFIVVPDEELQAWLRVFTGAQDAQRYSLVPEAEVISPPPGAKGKEKPSETKTVAAPNPSVLKTGGSSGSSGPSPRSSAAQSSASPGAQPKESGARSGSAGSASTASTTSSANTAASTELPPYDSMRTSSPNPTTSGTPSSAGTSARPLSAALPPAPTRSGTGTFVGGSGSPARPASLVLPAPMLPPDPNVMLGTVNDPDEAWSIGTIQPGLALDDPEDGPVIIDGRGNAPSLLPPQSHRELELHHDHSNDPSNSGQGNLIGDATVLDQSPAGPSGSPWTEYFDDDGVPYYHNEATNETTWERPPDFFGPVVQQQLPQLQQLPQTPQGAVMVAGRGPRLSRGGSPIMMRGGAPIIRGGYMGAPVIMRGGLVMRGGVPLRGAPIMMRGGVPLGRVMPSYPVGVAATHLPPRPGQPNQGNQGGQGGDAVDVLADLDEFGDAMKMGASPRSAAGANPSSPFGSNTLAELDQLNNPEFF